MVAKTKFVLQKKARTITSDGSVAHDGFSVSEDVGLVHEVGREENHFACLSLLEHVPKMPTTVGINPSCWLVKKYKPRVADQGDSYTEFSFLPSGQLGGLRVCFLLKISVL